MDITTNTLDRLTSAVLAIPTAHVIIACHADGSVRRVDSATYADESDALIAARAKSAQLRHRWYAVNVSRLLSVLSGEMNATAKEIATK